MSDKRNAKSIPSLFLGREDFLFVCFEASLYLLHIFGRWKSFRTNAAIKEHISHCTVVIDMLPLNTSLST